MITKEALVKEITADKLKIVKIISIAINLGVTIFLFVIIGMYLSNSADGNSDVGLVNMLMIILLFLALSVYGAAAIIPKNILKTNLKKSENMVGSYTTFHIIKLAMFEGPALFGLVILLLSVLNKSIYEFEYLFLSIIPTFILYAISIITFPSVYKVRALFEGILHEINNTKN